MRKFKMWPVTASMAGALFIATAASAQLAPPPAVGADNVGQANAAAATWQSKSVDVPEGTKVLLDLRSTINTRTARPGDGVYLSSSFPVVVNGQVAIPAGVYVQGVIDQVTRPGRVKGRAGVRMHFSSIIFPNGTVVNIPGVVNGLPGSSGPSVGKEGTVQQASSAGKDAGTVAAATGTGLGVGSLTGWAAGSPGAGAGYGAAAGAAGGLLYTLFTRGDDIVLGAGQSIEMVLQRPLTISQANLTGPDVSGTAQIVPTAQQPMAKPKVLCPAGGLGCS